MTVPNTFKMMYNSYEMDTKICVRGVSPMPQLRLDKYLSELGVASRRELREIIRSGRVCVDGVCVRDEGQRIDAQRASVSLDGRTLHYSRFQYYMLDKPLGVITATEDREQKTVLDLLPPELRAAGLFPVGRLDKDTSGLLLLTNDGDFAHRVIAPKSEVWKRYLARVDGVPDEADAAAFREGLVLADGTRCLSAVLEVSGEESCAVLVQEGKYHQVRRMLAARGKSVLSLRRVAIGALPLDETLGPGGFRTLSEEERSLVFARPSSLPETKSMEKQ